MKEQDLKKAIKEAKRFIRAGKAAIDAECFGKTEINGSFYCWNHSPQHTAAAKRASMDLTRALVKVRRSK